MTGKLRVVHLIPTYNEVENVVPMLDALDRVGGGLPEFEFHTLIADDRSPDGTGEKVLAYIREGHPEVHLLSGDKAGLGVAILRGMSYAVTELHADVVVTNDADFQFDPADTPRLLEPIRSGADVVVASRHIEGGGMKDWPLSRRILHAIADGFFATIVAGTREVSDHNGNFRAYRVKGFLDRIDLDAIPATGYGFLHYFLYVLSREGAVIAEVPVVFGARERGEPKVGLRPKYFRSFLRDSFEYVRLCVAIRRDRMRRKP